LALRRFSPSRLKFGWMPPHPTLYVRRSLLTELGGFDVSLRIAADYDFMLRYLSHPDMRVVYVPRVLVKMRTGGASNRSLTALLDKSREDLRVLRRKRNRRDHDAAVQERGASCPVLRVAALEHRPAATMRRLLGCGSSTLPHS
jgi:hypothetical protein